MPATGRHLRRFLLQVLPAKSYYAAYFWKPFLMGNQPGNQLAIDGNAVQSAGQQMHLSRIR
jgi:hypothetical protein